MSIRIKIFAGLVLAFTLLLGAVNLFLMQNSLLNNKKSIQDDLTAIQRNSQIYIKQDLLMNAGTMDADGFSNESGNIVADLGRTTNADFTVYDSTGKRIAPDDDAVAANLPDKDLRLAMQGKAAYTLQTVGGKTAAAFSFPVALGGQTIGAVRCVKDYSALYRQSGQSIRLVNLIILSGFLMCLLFGAVLSRSVISPVRRLCLNLQKTAGELRNDRLNPDTIKEHIRLTRRDEIGDLSRSIAELLGLISRQMTVIRNDRDELKRVSAYRRDFYHTVTHELKTPLTSIKGYAEVARENGFTDREFFDTAMTRIVEESDRLHELVVSLLEKSSLHSTVEIPFERVNLSDIAQSVCDSMKYKADKYERTIQFQPMVEAWVLGNPQNLKELAVNLIDNAVKYASDSRIDVRVAKDAAQVTLEVRNRAAGLSQKEADRLFRPFYRSREATLAHEKGSVGLGLSICRQIAGNHRGSISLSVSEDKYFSAAVNLPVYGGMEQ